VVEQLMPTNSGQSNEIGKTWRKNEHGVLKRYQDVRIE
jgi:hypothetical protein